MPIVLPLSKHRLYYALLAVALLLVAYGGWVSVQSSTQMSKTLADAEQSQTIIAYANETLVAFGSTESFGLRWAITFKPKHWQRFQLAMDQLDAAAGDLRAATENEPAARELADTIVEAVRNRRVYGEAVWGRLQRGGVSETVALLSTGTGDDLGADVRRSVGALVSNQRMAHKEREIARQQSMADSQRTILLAIGLGVLSGLVGILATMQSRLAWVRERESSFQRERAEAASAEKSLFLATMSHEIRTPMNAIFGFSQLLGRRVHDPKSMEYVRAIRASGQALLALINDLLVLSKIEAGRMNLVMAATDVRELVDSTVAVFSEPVAGKGLRITADIDPFLPTALMLDPHRLRQVLMNLVSNAVKYTDRGVIRVAVRAEPKTVGIVDMEITVEDSGQGIPPEEMDRIFDPFHRVLSGGSALVEGTGLGLSIVRRLVEVMDGRISVDSELGRGSIFTVTLPNLSTGTLDRRVNIRNDRANFATLAPSRILIVDDVPLNRELLSAYLADAGHELAFAEDGVGALTQVVQWKPTLVLMDLRMPRLDGLEAARQIRAMPDGANVCLVAVTASSMADEDGASKKLFDAYLRKPIDAQALFNCLLELAGTRRNPEGCSSEAQDERDAERGGDTAAPNPREATLAAVVALERMALSRLPHVQSTMLMRDVRVLAEDIVAKGAQGGLHRVLALGQRLLAAVDGFDLTTIDSLLDQLPRYIAAERSRLESE